MRIKLNYFINNFIKKEEIFLGGEERGIFALGCAMGGRERCLLVANESVWRGEKCLKCIGERDVCAWLRHGREGEERCVYKRMVFGCLVTERTCYRHHVHHPVHRLRRLS